MKTPIDYLATEFKAITRMDISDMPKIELIDQHINAIQILIDLGYEEDYIVQMANDYALELRDSTLLMYA